MRRAKGIEAQGIGRARGGLTTRVHAAVDALGLPVRLIPTPGRSGDCPQAAAPIDGLEGVGRVIADAA
jgi:transposase